MSARSQIIIIIWGLVFLLIYGFTMWGLVHMMPPPPPAWSAERIAQFYRDHTMQIRIGALIMSWVGGFGVPIAVVCSVQIKRLEKGLPVWSWMSLSGGILMSLFLVLPPIMWGTAAYTADRAPGVTAMLHELSLLTLTTTDQYFIFYMVAIGVASLGMKDKYTAFPRWFGFLTIWAALAFEVGAFAFIPKSGPFAWNGALVFWMPLSVYGAWLFIMCGVLINRISRQAAAGVIDGS